MEILSDETTLPRLKILLLAHNLEGIGTYLRFQGMAHALAKLGHQVTLVGPDHYHLWSRQLFIDNLKIINTPVWFSRRLSNGGLAPEDILFRIGHLLDEDYDIVHASEHRPAASLPALFSRRLHRSIYVSDWADLWGWGGIMEERSPLTRFVFGQVETYWEKHTHRLANAMTVISTDLYERACRMGVSQECLLHLPNGVDTAIVKPVEDRLALRRELGLPTTGKLLIFAGQAALDIDLVWRSFEIVFQKYPDVYLVVLGRVWSNTNISSDTASHVIQLGYQRWADYLLTLACGDVMLLPYRNNSRNLGRWPGKLSFYMAAGRPTVSNPTGDIKTLFEAKGVGLLATETHESIAERVLELLADSTFADRLGKQAREIAVQEYEWSFFAKQLTKFYTQISMGIIND
jgi:glycosyltransferase involved in cell wall biosynthesis